MQLQGSEYPIRPFRAAAFVRCGEPRTLSQVETTAQKKVLGPVGFLGSDQSIDD